jgi:hypothetical protein
MSGPGSVGTGTGGLNPATTVTVPAKAILSNVVPTLTHKVTFAIDSNAFPSGPAPYDPNKVGLDQAVAGFSSVIEISSQCCLRHFAFGSSPLVLLAEASGENLVTFADSAQSTDFAQVDLGPDFPAFDNYLVGAVFVPVDLNFQQPDRVIVTYSGTFVILGSSIGTLGRVLPEPLKHLLDQVLHDPYQGFAFTTLASPKLTATFQYESTTNLALTRLEVYVKSGGAVLDLVVPAGDAEGFWQQFIGPKTDVSQLKSSLGKVPVIPLAPSISLVGRNATDNLVTEFDRFDVTVVSVGNHPHDALAACIDVLPGAAGASGSVHHFIGTQDYGVISDEYVVERLFKYHWRIGDFRRSFNFSTEVLLRYQDTDQDGLVDGVLRLTSLDLVSIEPESNTRADFIRIGGLAEGIIERVELRDGTVLGPEDVPDLDKPQVKNWAAFTVPSLQFHPADDVQVRDFQLSVGTGGYRPAACPFTRAPVTAQTLRAVYARIDGVSRRVMFLGMIDGALI